MAHDLGPDNSPKSNPPGRVEVAKVEFTKGGKDFAHVDKRGHFKVGDHPETAELVDIKTLFHRTGNHIPVYPAPLTPAPVGGIAAQSRPAVKRGIGFPGHKFTRQTHRRDQAPVFRVPGLKAPQIQKKLDQTSCRRPKRSGRFRQPGGPACRRSAIL